MSIIANGVHWFRTPANLVGVIADFDVDRWVIHKNVTAKLNHVEIISVVPGSFAVTRKGKVIECGWNAQIEYKHN